MIPAQENRILETSGMDNNVKAGFKIEAHPFAFDVMTKKLYSDTIKSIIRELACNAYDAGVMRDKVWDSGGDTTYLAPKGSTFTVKLPNSFDPMFTIMDSGVGLAVDQMTGLYTTLFSSTKRDSNDVIGAFGLGSKTPFSYTDQFIVVSTHNGIKYTWNAFKNPQGMPEITLVHQVKTDAKNGLSVSMSVKPNDFQQFVEKAKQVFAWFDEQPNVTGVSGGFKPHEISVDTTFDIQSCRMYVRNNAFSGFYVKQGQVAYPVRANTFSHHTLDKTQREILGYNIIIDVPIGAVSVTPSREELSMDSHTESTIIKAISGITAEAVTKIEKIFADAPNLHEGRKLYAAIEKSTGLHQVLHMCGKKSFKIKDGRLTDSSYLRFTPYETKEKLVNVDAVDPISGATTTKQVKVYRELYQLYRAKETYSKLHVEKLKYDTSFDINFSKPFFLVDSKENISSVKFKRKIRHYLETNAGTTHEMHFVVLGDSDFSRKDCLNEFLEAIKDYPHVAEFSALPEPPKVVKPKATVVSTVKKVLKFNHKAHMTTPYNGLYDLWSETDHDVTKGGVYVITEKRIPVGYGSWENFKNIVKDLRKTGIIDDKFDLFAFQQVGKKIPEENKGWVPFEDYVKAQVAKSNLNKLFAIMNLNTPRSYDVLSENIKDYKGKNAVAQLFVKNNITQTAEYKALQTLDRSSLRIIVNRFGDPNVKLTSTADADLRAIIQVYPMLVLMLNSNIDKKAYLQYINLIDALDEKGNT